MQIDAMYGMHNMFPNATGMDADPNKANNANAGDDNKD